MCMLELLELAGILVPSSGSSAGGRLSLFRETTTSRPPAPETTCSNSQPEFGHRHQHHAQEHWWRLRSDLRPVEWVLPGEDRGMQIEEVQPAE